MPGTRRVPITRTAIPQITPRAIELFDALRRCRCSCPPIDWEGEYWKRDRCAGCERWWDLHHDLHRELHCKPWHFPCVEDPDARSPYPEGSAAYAAHQPDLEAQTKWRALAKASRETRRTKAAARKAAAAPTSPPEQPTTP